jgi:excisionase family DNA binding protein
MGIRGGFTPKVKEYFVDTERLMTAADAAKVLGVVPNSVRRMTDTGELPSIRTVGGFRLIKQSDVERLAAARAESTDTRVTKPGPLMTARVPS